MAHGTRRLVAIINPATRGNASRIVELLALAAPAGTTVETYFTERAGHAFDLALTHGPGSDLLVAIGGDGTVGEVASAARPLGVPMGIVPGGSTNIVAKDLGIPTNVNQAVRLLFEGSMRKDLDVGICGEHVFLHMAGAGIDSHLFDLANPDTKRRVGWLAYVPAAIRALQEERSVFTIRSEEQTIENVLSPMVLVANGASVITPMLQLDSRIKYDDGFLDVMVITATTPSQLAQVIANMARRRVFDSPYVMSFQTREVWIEAEPTIAVQLDGDVAQRTPVHFTLQPRAISVLVPKR